MGRWPPESPDFSATAWTPWTRVLHLAVAALLQTITARCGPFLMPANAAEGTRTVQDVSEY